VGSVIEGGRSGRARAAENHGKMDAKATLIESGKEYDGMEAKVFKLE
jgi:hypothetical protein